MKVEEEEMTKRERGYNVELIETGGTTDSKSGGSGVAVCGVAAAKAAACMVGLKKLH